jgi:putative ABC transport system permease protein
MVLRHIAGRPLRSLLTATGIAAAVALQISGAFWRDTLDELVDLQYRHAQRGDVTVEFFSPRAPAVVDALRRLPGVLDAQAWRSEPARLIAGGRAVDVLVTGLSDEAQLMRVVGRDRHAVRPSADAVTVNALAARELGVGPGDTVTLAFRQWHRRQIELRVESVVHTSFGRVVLMDLATLRRVAGDGEGVGQAIVSLDPSSTDAFFAALQRAPAVAAVGDRAAALESFERTTARNLGFFTGVLTLFAVAMAAGITYNAVRIALAERAWELASLRVMGMTRAEVSALLLAEVGILVLAAVPAGCLLGWGLAHFLVSKMASDSVDFPVVILPATYAWAVLAVLAAAAASALAVRRRIDRLDLVAVLKVRP